MSEATDLLRSIDASLKALLALQRGTTPKAIASDGDLDGPYGDPEIKAQDPRDWAGPTMRGKHFSECSAEYLDLLADRFEYFADNADRDGTTTTSGKPVAPYNRRDAARARGWAKRLRAGYTAPTRADATPATWADDSEIPF